MKISLLSLTKMQNDGHLAMMRKARDNKSVLKIKFVSLRGSRPDDVIFAFEGDDDKIVYSKWLARLHSGKPYQAFVCKGKKGVRLLQNILSTDLNGLSKNTYLFVDRDFDDDLGFIPSTNLFITETYSIENVLVCEQVLDAVLRDEFPCHEDVGLRSSIVTIFTADYDRFLELTREFNKRLFIARRLSIPLLNSLPEKVRFYATIEINGITPPTLAPEQNVVMAEEPDQFLLDPVLSQFSALEPSARYRGKNAFLFFERWIDRLCDQFATQSGLFEDHNCVGRIRKDELTLGTFASKSPMPAGLSNFLSQISW